jgi:drug/metabolite transporter, DME family
MPTPVLSARRPLAGVPLLAVAGVLWGTGGLLGALLGEVSGLSPMAVATYRLTVGGALLCGYLLLTGRRLPRTGAALRRVAAVGALAAAFQGCYFAAVSCTSVSLATLVTIGTAPVVVLVAERLAGRRASGRRTVLGACLALLGLGLLVGVPSGGAAQLPGVLLAAAAGTGFAAMTLLAGRPVPGLDAPTTVGVGFVLGGVALVPGALLAAPAGLAFDPTPATVGVLVALGAVPTALAYTAWFRGLLGAPAGVGAVLALLEPLTAAGLAALVFGDRLGWAGLAGAAVLCVALALVGTADAQERVRSS